MVVFKPERLRELRKDANMTQKQFSESIGCTMASLSAYENGSKIPPTQTLINISNKYSCSIDWLMGLKDEKDYDNSETAIKTYSDYIKRLFVLDIPPVTLKVNHNSNDTLKGEPHCNGIAFTDPIIKLFLESWDKTRNLYASGTIDNTIFEAWKEKVLKDFKYPIIRGDDDYKWQRFNEELFSYERNFGTSEYENTLAALHDVYNPVSYEPDK